MSGVCSVAAARITYRAGCLALNTPLPSWCPQSTRTEVKLRDTMDGMELDAPGGVLVRTSRRQAYPGTIELRLLC